MRWSRGTKRANAFGAEKPTTMALLVSRRVPFRDSNLLRLSDKREQRSQ